MTNEVVTEQELGGAVVHTKKSGGWVWQFIPVYSSSLLTKNIIKISLGVAHKAFENDVHALYE